MSPGQSVHTDAEAKDPFALAELVAAGLDVAGRRQRHVGVARGGHAGVVRQAGGVLGGPGAGQGARPGRLRAGTGRGLAGGAAAGR